MGKVGIFLGNYGNTLQKDFPLSDLESKLKSKFAVVHALYGNDDENNKQISRICEEEGLSAIVLGGALSKWQTGKYSFNNNSISEAIPVIEANIREQCGWAYTDGKVVLIKAEQLILIAAARAMNTNRIKLSNRRIIRRVMIIGGSRSAFEVARSAALAGLDVILVKSGLHPDTLFPPDDELIKDVTSNNELEIIEDAELCKLTGEAGNFFATIKQDNESTQHNIGAVVFAIEPDIFPLELESSQIGGKVQSIKAFMDDLAENNLDSETVGFWLDRAMPERHDVIVAVLKSATGNIKNGGKSYIFLRNMPIFGHLGQKAYDEAREIGAQFLRYAEGHPFFERSGDSIEASVQDAILKDVNLKVKLDRLIMPSLIMPGVGISNLRDVLNQPLDTEGFLQSGNVHHRPVSSLRKGIFFAGNCHDNFDPMESRLEAEAVTTQVMHILPDKPVNVPFGMVRIDKGKCANCLTCVRSCPHGAIDPYNLKSSITIFNNACWECGICATVCPGQAIEHSSLSDLQLEQAVKTACIEISDSKPLVVFACRQSAVPSLNKATEIGLSLPVETTIIEVPCAGRIGEKVIFDALVSGAGRVIVAACHPDICRSLRGNTLARKRVERVKNMLSSMDLNPDLVQFHPIGANEPYRMINLINSAVEEYSVVAAAFPA